MYDLDVPSLIGRYKRNNKGNAELLFSSRTGEVLLHLPYVRAEIEGKGLSIFRRTPIITLKWSSPPFLGRITFDMTPEEFELWNTFTPILFMVSVEFRMTVSDSILLELLLFDVDTGYYNVVITFYYEEEIQMLSHNFPSSVTQTIDSGDSLPGIPRVQLFMITSTSSAGFPWGVYRLSIKSLKGFSEKNIEVFSHAILRIL